MNTNTCTTSEPRLVLDASTAADLMNPKPISVEADESIRHATAFLVDNGYTAAPVIDEAGKLMGVLSQTDLLIHQREAVAGAYPSGDFLEESGLPDRLAAQITTTIEALDVDQTRVRDVMTPVVFSVSPTTPASKVVDQLLKQGVHRLYVVDDSGVLVGIVSTIDILRRLK